MERTEIRPDYYRTESGFECADVIREVLGRDGFESFCLGNVFKYLWRHGEKSEGKADLIKARTYLDFLIGD